MLRVGGILQTALYVDDLSRSAGFYRRLFSFGTLRENKRIVTLKVADRNVLLLLPKWATKTSSLLVSILIRSMTFMEGI